MSTGRSKVVVDIEANVNQVNSTLKTVQANLEKLNLPPSVEKNFNQVFSKLDKEITNLKAKTGSAISSPAEMGKVIKNWETVLELYRKLGVQIKNLDTLSAVQKQALVPSDTAEKIKKASDAFKNYEAEIKKVQKDTATAKGQFTKTSNAVKDLEEKLNKLKASSNNVISDESFKKLKKASEDANEELARTQELLKAAEAQINDAPKTSTGKVDKRTKAGREASQNYDKAQADYEAAQDKAVKAQAAVDSKQSQSAYNKNLASTTEQLERAKKKVEDYAAALEKLKNTDSTAALDKLKQKLTEITGTDLTAANSIDDVKLALQQLYSQGADEANKKIQEFEELLAQVEPEAAKATKGINDATQSLKEMVAQENDIENLKRRLVSFFSIGGIVQTFRRAISSAYSSVKELDAVMTETAVVTDFDISDMWEQLPKYTDEANKLGASVKGAYETLTLFYQQGLNQKQAWDLGIETMKMARIANLDYATATDYMTAALRGFGLELDNIQAKRINDVYSELAAITASDTAEISVAMTKTASIANNANMELETTAALLAQIIETTREAPETAGTAMKTIIARFQELKKDPSEIEDVDGESVDANKIETALRSIGVALRDSTGQFRDLDDVFLDISKKWGDLDTNTQRYIATMAAGSRQQSRFIAMMSDYDRTMELVAAANNSAGSSQRQFDKTVESLDTKINHLSNSWQTFVQGLANNTLIKAVVDSLAWILDRLNAITDVLGANGISDFVITLTLILTLFSKIKGLLDGILTLSQAFKTGLDKGIAEKVEKGIKDGTNAASKDVERIMEEAVREGTRKGMEQGVEAANIEEPTAEDGKPTERPAESGDSTPPTMGDAPQQRNPWGKAKGAVKSGVEKAGAWVGRNFGNLQNFMYALSAAATAVSGVTKALQYLEDKAYDTADEQLETVQSLKTDIEAVASSLDEKIVAVDSQKATYDDNQLTVRASGGIIDDTSKKAIKSNNELVRTIRSEFPKIAEYTKYQNGQWETLEGFWGEYKSTLEEQKQSLDNLTSALEARESQLSYESYTGGNIKTSDVVSESEEQGIQKATGIGAAIGGGAALAGAGAAGLFTFLPLLGVAAPIIAAAAIAAAGALLVGGATGIISEALATSEGVSQRQINSSAGAISQYGTLTQQDVDKLLNGNVNEDDELQQLLNNLGGSKKFQELWEAAGENVDVLNQLAVEFENTATAQMEYRQELMKTLGISKEEDTERKTSQNNIAAGMILSSDKMKENQENAQEEWNKKSAAEQEAFIDNIMSKYSGAVKSEATGKWMTSTGEEYSDERLEEIAVASIYEEKNKDTLKAGFDEKTAEEWVELAKSLASIDLENIKQEDITKEMLMALGNTEDQANYKLNNWPYSQEGIREELLEFQNGKIGQELTVIEGLLEQAEKNGGSAFGKTLYEKGNVSAAKNVLQMPEDVQKQIEEAYNEANEEDKEAIEKVLSMPITSMDDLRDTIQKLRQINEKLNLSELELAKQLKLTDVGKTVTSSDVSSIAEALAAGSALSLEQANMVSQAIGKGGVNEEMSEDQLYKAGFTKTENGYLLTGVSAAEAIEKLNQTMMNDVSQIKTVLENKYGREGIDNETVDKDNLYDSATLSGMNINEAKSVITQTSDVETGIYHTNGLSENALATWDQYLDTQLALIGATEEYEIEKKKLGKLTEEQDKALKEEITRTGQLKKALVKVADVVESVTDDLDSEDPTKVSNALAKIAVAASELGYNLTPDQVKGLKNEFLTIAKGGDGVKEAIAKIAAAAASNEEPLGEFSKKLEDIEEKENFLKELSSEVYKLKMTGEADFTNVFNQLLAVGATADQAKDILQAMVGSGVAMEVEWDTVPLDLSIPEEEAAFRKGAITKKVPRLIWKNVDSDALNNYGGSTGGNKGGSSSGGSSSKYENNYDKRYNLVEDISEEQRTLNKLEAEYQKLLDGTNTSASKLLNNYEKQRASLQKQEKLNEKLLSYRKQDMKDYLRKNSKYSDYATYNWKDNTIEINWNKINAITDSEKGEKVDDYISGLEEAQSRIEDVEDTLIDIEQSIRDLGQEQIDKYISSLNQVRDAIIEARQAEIDRLSSIDETLNDQNQRMFDAVQKVIDAERQARENDKTEQDIADKERRLAQLQMDTGDGNQTEILQLQKELDDARQDYSDSLVDQQLQRMQDEADEAADQRGRQISLMEEQLDIYQKSEQIWNDIYDLWDTAFTKNGEFKPGSQLAQLLMDTADYVVASQEEKAQLRGQWGEDFGEGAAGKKILATKKDVDMSKELKAAERGQISNQTGIDYGAMDQNTRNSYKKAITDEGKSRVANGVASADETKLWGSNKKQTTTKKVSHKNGHIASVKKTTVKSGVNGAATEAIQRGINDLISDGYIKGISKLSVDGRAGPLTIAAIKKLQSLVGTNADGSWGPNSRKAFRNSAYKAYATGGLADYTGPAWLDGTKSHPELVLNARDTENFIQLKDVLSDVLKRNNSNPSEKSGDNYYEIHINVEKMDDDYDVEQLADKLKNLIAQDAMYRNVTSINRLR